MQGGSGRETDHGPDGVANGLADRASDEDDIRDGEDGSPASEVAEHASDQASNERTESRSGRYKFLSPCV